MSKEEDLNCNVPDEYDTLSSDSDAEEQDTSCVVPDEYNNLLCDDWRGELQLSAASGCLYPVPVATPTPTPTSSPTSTPVASPSDKQTLPENDTSPERKLLDRHLRSHMWQYIGALKEPRFDPLLKWFKGIYLSDLVDEVIRTDEIWDVIDNDIRLLMNVFWGLHVAPLIKLRRQDKQDKGQTVVLWQSYN